MTTTTKTKRYLIHITVSGYVEHEIDASSPEEAIKLAVVRPISWDDLSVDADVKSAKVVSE